MSGKNTIGSVMNRFAIYSLAACMAIATGAATAAAGPTTYNDATYGYDANYQVESVDLLDDGSATTTTNYTYDTMGNRTMKATYTSGATNNPPGAFNLLAPSTGTLKDINVTFQWEESVDQDTGDTVTYELHLGKTSGVLECIYKGPDTSFDAGILEPNTTYYWKVYAIDSQLASTASAQSSFTTMNAVMRDVDSSDAKGLQAALTASTGNGMADIIRIAGGTYHVFNNNSTHFSFSSAETNNLYIYGGYSPDFTERDPDKYPTVLDGDGIGRAGNGGVLSIQISGASIYTDIEIEGLVVQNGSASGNGGGISITSNAGDITVSGSDFLNCAAGGEGGAVYAEVFDGNYLSGSIKYEGNRLTYNSAGGSGGGAYFAADSIYISNSVIAGNTSSGAGGGCLLNYDGVISALNNTVTLNESVGYGGGMAVVEAQTAFVFEIRIQNNILEQNSSFSLGDDLCLLDTKTPFFGYVISSNYLDTNSVHLDLQPAPADYTGNITDPAGPGMTDPVHGDFHLDTGSACIDAGAASSLVTDIEGNPRDDGNGVDIGAYEYTLEASPDPTPVVAVTDPMGGDKISGATYTITGTSGSPVSNSITGVDVSFNGTDWNAASDTSGTGSFATWEYQWTVPGDGAYTISARATDGTDTGYSDNVDVEVGNFHTVTCSVYPEDGGSVSFSPPSSGNVYPDGDTVTITVTPNSGYGAFYWFGDASGSSNPLVLDVDSDKNIAVNFGADVHPPISVISSPTDGASASGTVNISGTSSDQGGSVSLVEVDTGDGSGWHDASGTGTWSYSWTSPPDGEYTIRTRATDNTGNVEPFGSGIVVTVDSTAPSTTIISNSDGDVVSGAYIVITGTASDAGSGVAVVEIDMGDGAGWRTVSGTGSWSYGWSTSGDGDYVVRTRAADAVGNTETPGAGITVTVDNTPPTITTFVINDGAAYTNNTSVQLTLDASDAGGIGEMRFSNDSSIAWSSWAAYAASSSWFMPSGDGLKTVSAIVRDDAGNITGPVSDTIILDTVAPTGTFDIDSGAAFTNSTSVTLDMNVSDDNAYISMRFKNRLTGEWSGWEDYASGKPWTLDAENGLFSVYGQFKDQAGNVLETSADIIMDTYPPVSDISSPVENQILTGTTYNITGTAEDFGSGVDTVDVNTGDGSGWNGAAKVPGIYSTTLDSAGVVGWYSSLKFDASGYAHVSYHDFYNHDLKYATDKSGDWVSVTVDSVGQVGKYCSLAVAPDGFIHISYIDETSKFLKYATNASGTWQSVVLDDTGQVSYTAIDIDSSGYVHIAYYDTAGGDLKYANNVNSGVWDFVTVDSANFVGQYPSLAVDNTGHVHVSYYDSTNNDLKYATNISGQWISTTLDSSGIVGKFGSLAVDDNGHVHISYYDTTNLDLKYASNASGDWVATTLDSGGSVGTYTSLALDRNGKLHISYKDATNNRLKHATNVTGEWVYITVGSNGVSDYGTSVAVNINGDVGISYSISGDLNYELYVPSRYLWSYSWTLPADGTYNIVSGATDAVGYVEDTQTKPGVNVVVDNDPPTIQITDPLDSAEITTTSYTITGTADDGVGSGVTLVEVGIVNGYSTTWYAVDTYDDVTGAWSYSWDTPSDKSYTVKARATDAAGHVQTSTGLAVTVEARTPTTTASPAEGLYLLRQEVTLTSDEAATKYYTTDGSTPTTSSDSCSGNCTIQITESTELNYFAVDGTGNQEDIKTSNYTINPLPVWSDSVGSFYRDQVYAISADSSGNVYAAGSASSVFDGSGSYYGDEDAVIVKYDSNGNKLWSKQEGTSSSDRVYGVCVDGSGNVYAVGYTGGALSGSSFGGFDYFAIKYNSSGVKQWTKQYGTTGNDSAVGAFINSSGNLAIVGYTYGAFSGYTLTGISDVFVAELNTSNGSHIQTTQAGVSGTSMYASDAYMDASGNFYVTGYSYGDVFTAMLLSDGTIDWIDFISDSGSYSVADSISVDSSGNVFITGYTDGTVDGNTNIGQDDYFLAKYDSTGTLLWTRQLGTSVEDEAYGVATDSDDEVYVTGYTTGSMGGLNNTGLKDIFVSKFDNDGGLLWAKVLGSKSYDEGRRLYVDSGKHVYLAGSSSGKLDLDSNAGQHDFFVMKFDGAQLSSDITSPSEGAVVNSAGITITGTADDDKGPALDKVEISVNGWANWTSCTDTSGDGSWSTWSYDWTPAADGDYTLVSRATDINGVVEAPTSSVGVTAEITPPASAVSDPANCFTLSTSVGSYTVTGTASDGQSGVTLVEVAVNGAGWVDAEDTSGDGSWSTWQYFWNYSTGAYTVQSRATDVAGNIETPLSGPTVLTPAHLDSIAFDQVTSFWNGPSITCTASASGGVGDYQYKFMRRGNDTPNGGNDYVLVQDWSTDDTWVWDTSCEQYGSNYIMVWVRNNTACATGDDSDHHDWEFHFLNEPVVDEPVIRFINYTTNENNNPSYEAGMMVNWSTFVTSTPDTDNFVYRYERKGPDTDDQYVMFQNWTSSNTMTWTPTYGQEGGNYILVKVRRGCQADTSGSPYLALRSEFVNIDPNNPISVDDMTADKASPQVYGEAVEWTTTMVFGTYSGPVSYRYCRMGPDTAGDWVYPLGWVSDDTDPDANKWTWTPDESQVGINTVKVQVRRSTMNMGIEDYAEKSFTVTYPAPVLGTLTADPPSPYFWNTTTPVTFTMSASGGSGDFEYRFKRRGPDTFGNYTMVQDWSPSDSWVWDDYGCDQKGEDYIMAWVRNAGDPEGAAEPNTWLYYFLGNPATTISIGVDKPGPYCVGAMQNWTTTATFTPDGGDYEYLFERRGPDTAGVYVVEQNWSTADTCQWTPEDYQAGFNFIMAKVRPACVDGDSTTSYLVYNYRQVYVEYPNKLKSVSLNANETTPVEYGTFVNFSAMVDRGTYSFSDFSSFCNCSEFTGYSSFENYTGPVEYRFLRSGFDTSGYEEFRGWQSDDEYPDANKWTWVPTEAQVGAGHVVQVQARRKAMDDYFEVNRTMGYSITYPTPVIDSLTPDPPSPGFWNATTPVTFTMVASGGSGNYEYKFKRRGPETSGQYVLVQDWSSSDTWSWDDYGPGQYGSNYIMAWVRNAEDPYVVTPSTWVYYYIGNPAATISVGQDKTGPYCVGAMQNWTTTKTFTPAGGDYEYLFQRRGPETAGQYVVEQNWSTADNWQWTPEDYQAGFNFIMVKVRPAFVDGDVTTSYLAYNYRQVHVENPNKLSANPLAADKTSPQPNGVFINFSTTVNRGFYSYSSFSSFCNCSSFEGYPSFESYTGSVEYRFLRSGPDTVGYEEFRGWMSDDEYGDANNWTWAPGAAQVGSHTIQVQVRRKAMNDDYEGYRTMGYTITLDDTAPSGTIDIESGATETTSAGVALTLYASDEAGGSGVRDMILTDDGSFTGKSWENYTTSRDWTFNGQLGEKTVEVMFKDGAGNESAVSDDTIRLTQDNYTTLWIVQDGTEYEDHANALAMDASGNIFIAGSSDGVFGTYSGFDDYTSFGAMDATIAKYDSEGNVVWKRQLGSSANDEVTGISFDGYSTLYVVGRSYGVFDNNSSAGDADFILAKYNTSGVRLWSVQGGTSGYDSATGVYVSGGYVYVAGNVSGGIDNATWLGGVDTIIMKYDTNGNRVTAWTQSIGGSSDDYCTGFTMDGSGNLYVSGTTTGSDWDGGQGTQPPANGQTDIFAVKYDSGGNESWRWFEGNASFEDAPGIAVDADGNVYVAGRTDDAAGASVFGDEQGGSDMILVKLGSGGILQWSLQDGCSDYDTGNSVVLDEHGNVYVGGLTACALDGLTANGLDEGFLIKYDPTDPERVDTTNPPDNKHWSLLMTTNQNDTVTCIIPMGGDKVLVGGYTEGAYSGYTNQGSADLFFGILQPRVQ